MPQSKSKKNSYLGRAIIRDRFKGHRPKGGGTTLVMNVIMLKKIIVQINTPRITYSLIHIIPFIFSIQPI